MKSLTKNKKEIEKYKNNIWKLYVFHFLANLFFISAILVPFFTEWGKITFFQIMILQAVFRFSMLFFEVPTGAFADTFGRKKSIVLGAFITSLGAFCYISLPNFYIFILAELLWGLGAAFISGADQSLIFESLKETKNEKLSKKILGRYESIALSAILIGSIIGGFLAENFGLRIPMLFSGISILLASIFAFLIKEPKSFEKIKKENYFKNFKEGFFYFKNHKKIKVLALEIIFISSFAFFLIWVYQLILQQQNFPIKYFGLVHAGITLSQILVLNNLVKVEKLFGGKNKYLLSTGITTGTGFLVLGFTNNLFFLIPAFLIISAFGITRGTLIYNEIHHKIKIKQRATVISTISMLVGIISVLINLIFGFLIEKNLSYSLIFLGTITIFTTIYLSIKRKNL